MAKTTVMVGGVGGQGSLLFGQMLAQSGLARYKYATYFPNYGGLMRGGASECTVSLSNDPINSMIKLKPDAAVAMSPGYFTEFEKRLKSGGTLFIDSSVVSNKVTRDDIKVYSIPATETALAMGAKQISNVVLLGAYLQIVDAQLMGDVEKYLEKKLGGGRNEHLLDLDKKALKKGAELAKG